MPASDFDARIERAMDAMDAEDDRKIAAEDRLDDLADAQSILRDAEVEVDRARADRDEMAREIMAGGVSAYRVAQVLGISQQAVAKIRRA